MSFCSLMLNQTMKMEHLTPNELPPHALNCSQTRAGKFLCLVQLMYTQKCVNLRHEGFFLLNPKISLF